MKRFLCNFFKYVIKTLCILPLVFWIFELVRYAKAAPYFTSSHNSKTLEILVDKGLHNLLLLVLSMSVLVSFVLLLVVHMHIRGRLSAYEKKDILVSVGTITLPYIMSLLVKANSRISSYIALVVLLVFLIGSFASVILLVDCIYEIKQTPNEEL